MTGCDSGGCRHPGDQTHCPKCKAKFAAPDMREIDGDNSNLAYHCPECGYQYAKWPKTLFLDQSIQQG